MNSPPKCAGCPNALLKKEYLQCLTCKGQYDLDCANFETLTQLGMDEVRQHVTAKCEGSKRTQKIQRVKMSRCV
ncbi:unnamed protein product [Leptidea sinapis]|uniref:Uncharacterized protein n=1 Tax=Leptidea sinapis TaxID=189913 RepID=A0A5E4QK56_9NEOP|nr:unnamed protein product [Leptidea sinapis]